MYAARTPRAAGVSNLQPPNLPIHSPPYGPYESIELSCSNSDFPQSFKDTKKHSLIVTQNRR